MTLTTWDAAKCAGMDTEIFFSDDPEPAKAICRGCPLRVPCAHTAAKDGLSGVWGGTTEPERPKHPQPRRPRMDGKFLKVRLVRERHRNLSPEDAQYVFRAYWHPEESYGDIAKVFGSTAETVRRRINTVYAEIATEQGQ
ncbi:WhiB family transcriptional regulator [Mycolicibacterium sp.]|uniref:WhiB family transcriptional regulator n=1 Tax=Mycolicibacterium sp. TaxID=2320850 RepID=UPI00356072CA